MKTVDQILTANHIEHESDKCLVRVIGQALANPNTAKSVLLDASGLTLKADLQLASAMIETVKTMPDSAATVATPSASDAAAIQRAPRNLALAISLVISLLALSGTVVAYLNVAKESKGRGAKIVELEQSSQTQQEISRKEYLALSEKTTAALSAAGVSVSEFKIVTGDFITKSEVMTKQIAELRAENTLLVTKSEVMIKQIAEFRAENTRFITQSEVMTKQIAELRAENTLLITKSEVMTKQIAELRAENALLITQSEVMTKQIAELQAENTLLKSVATPPK
ncbi:MAG: hypothetical protein NTX09_03085 [Verrucomicrobia bacterium]|nr:hypothetical protein [Verrucomicrobiota bacterium]